MMAAAHRLRSAGIVRPQHAARVHAHDGRAGRLKLARVALAGRLRCGIGPGRRRDGRLGGEQRRPTGMKQRAEAGDVDDRVEPELGGDPEHVAGAPLIRLAGLVGLLPVDPDDRSSMHHRVAAVQRRPHERRVHDVAGHHLDIGGRDPRAEHRGPAPGCGRAASAVTRRVQRAHRVGADETGPTGHEYAHGPLLKIVVR